MRGPRPDQQHTPPHPDALPGVYKCGFSTKQEGFTAAESALFQALDELEALLR